MKKNLKGIRNCDCEWEEICPGLWVLIEECDKCRRQREIQMRLDDQGTEEGSGIVNERLREMRIQKKRKSKLLLRNYGR